ncbi:MAG: hypothetical protein ACI4MH_06165 [Candidatus Coproplasma sp.]
MEKIYYHSADDAAFSQPYTDIEELREDGSLYVHGGFKDTYLKFSFFFPEKEKYEGRFFQFMAPAEGSENASIGRVGEEDKITFALTHGAYFVESNMGSLDASSKPDSRIIFKASAAAADYSRQVAQRIYGYEHRPYGYIYGGSGGAFKTTSCFENADAWDGAVPYIHGSPMAIPNVFCARAYAKRVLRHKFPDIVDAFEPGGSGDVYACLNEEEREVLKEVTNMGFPLKSWFYYKEMDDGAFPVVAKSTIGIDPSYYTDFWTKEGYLGADKNSSVHRDRIMCDVTVKEVILPERKSESEVAEEKSKLTGADNAWKRNMDDYGANGKIVLIAEGVPQGDIYAYGANLAFSDGLAEGLTLVIDKIVGDAVILAPQFGATGVFERLEKVKAGDRARIDNSDYIAAQTFYRHQTPPEDGYIGWDQFRDGDGWKYPQRPFSVGPLIARGSCGSLQEGVFNGKMIVVAATMDESAFPWQIDWYRNKVKKHFGDKIDEHYRVYFFDNAFHDDSSKTVDELHLISYLGGLHQALLDLSAWVEKGIEPAKSSVYSIVDSQIVLAPHAEERCGIQPVITVTANGKKRAEVCAGEEVVFEADIEIPQGAGKLTAVEWSFNGEQDYPVKGGFTRTDRGGFAQCRYTYNESGTHFAVCRVSVQRDGEKNIFTQVKNLDRVRVVVK